MMHGLATVPFASSVSVASRLRSAVRGYVSPAWVLTGAASAAASRKRPLREIAEQIEILFMDYRFCRRNVLRRRFATRSALANASAQPDVERRASSWTRHPQPPDFFSSPDAG